MILQQTQIRAADKYENLGETNRGKCNVLMSGAPPGGPRGPNCGFSSVENRSDKLIKSGRTNSDEETVSEQIGFRLN